MPRYLARVELHNATSGDYAKLNHDMIACAFATSMMGDNGRRYALPAAEYFLDIELDLQAVRSLVENAVGRVGRDHVFIIVEIATATWSLHEQ